MTPGHSEAKGLGCECLRPGARAQGHCSLPGDLGLDSSGLPWPSSSIQTGLLSFLSTQVGLYRQGSLEVNILLQQSTTQENDCAQDDVKQQAVLLESKVLSPEEALTKVARTLGQVCR